MNKQPLITQQTRKNFISSFWELYKNEDFNKITVGNICKLANYNRTTFYRYFNDTNDLLSQLENDIINEIKLGIDKYPLNDKGLTLEGLKKFNKNYGEYIAIFYKKNNISFYVKFKELVKESVYDFLKINVKDENKKEFLYEFLFASIINAFAYWHLHPNIISFETFFKLTKSELINSAELIAKD